MGKIYTIQQKANFVLNAMKNTEGDSSHWYGVKFEPVLHTLIDSLSGR